MLNNRIVYILILALVMVLFVVTAGCYQQLNEQEKNSPVTTETLPTDTSWKAPIAERLLTEFYAFYENMYNDDIIYRDKTNYEIGEGKNAYSRTMAMDRATALLGVYKEYVTQKDLDFITQKAEEINSKIGMTSVSFAYTESGLHIIALSEGVTNNSLLYRPLCDKIRGFSDESAFFQEMNYEQRLMLCDVYVEDLKEARETISMDIDFYVSNGGDTPLKGEKVVDFSQESLSIFVKYNRQVPRFKNIFKNNEWQLFACTKSDYFDMININVDGEELRLQSVINANIKYSNLTLKASKDSIIQGVELRQNLSQLFLEPSQEMLNGI
jgi:hypothetical protein